MYTYVMCRCMYYASVDGDPQLSSRQAVAVVVGKENATFSPIANYIYI